MSRISNGEFRGWEEVAVTAEELAKLFETAAERWVMLSATIADPTKLAGYQESIRLCDVIAKSLRMALLDEAEFVDTITEMSAEMEVAKFCTQCGQKLTFGIARCPKCGKRPTGP